MRSRLTFVVVALLCSLLTVSAHSADQPIRVVVWDEQQPAQKEAYDNFLGNAIADYLRRQPGLEVESRNLGDPDQGLSDATLDDARVLIWWGHVRQQEITPDKARQIVARIKSGRLSLVALHSAHWSAPFVEAMYERTRQEARRRFPDPPGGPAVEFEFVAPPRGVPHRDSLVSPAYYATRGFDGVLRVRVDLPNCVFPEFRADGKPSQVQVLLPDHPLARGLPRTFQIPHTEMYNEPFHVPPPDEVVFEERWETGERFRSGSVWKIGDGRVVYFRPGHETFPVYRQPETLRVLENAVRWLGR
ncbi:MAG: ThuA domain-containing protein [Planctomycetales bacterium]